MASLLRERGTLRDSKKELSGDSFRSPSLSLSTMTLSESLPLPFGELGCNLSEQELRETAYEIFVAACRNTSGKPLAYVSSSERAAVAGSSTPSSTERSLSSVSSLSPSPLPSMQRSLTSSAASKMKKALGLKSSKKSPGKDNSPSRAVKKPVTIGELMRVQMRVSEQTDSRIRRGLLRISASHLGRRVESIILPLELMQQFKASDFSDPHDYETWCNRNLKLLEAGLLVHPLVSLDKSDATSQRLKQIIRGALGRPIETGKNSESMQVLRSAVMSLASRSADGFSSDVYHWADGSPLNLRLYHMLLEACFDYEEGSIIDEIDDLMDLNKKTWVVLGITQMLHNICFAWILFYQFVKTGQTDFDLLVAADNLLMEVAKDAKSTKDMVYLKILSSTLSSIMGWTEKRLLTYHDTFSTANIEFMEYIVSLGVLSAKILVEDISHEYRRKRREETDVARSRIDTYIRSSLRTSFAQMMEKVDSNRRSAKGSNISVPVLAILAKDIGNLADKEKKIYSPILKKWHPLAAGVAVATLHSCFGNELKQFIAGVTDLTFDSVQVLKAADKLEKDLVQIAVEDSVDSEDGGKGLIREMPPYEAESAIANLTKSWMKMRLDKLREWADRNSQQETWNPLANKEHFAPSAVEVLQLVDETLDAFFQLPIPMHPALLPDLAAGFDRSLQHYATKVKAGCGTRNTFIPNLPSLTRVEIRSKIWKKKKNDSRPQNTQRRNSQVGSTAGDGSVGLLQFCVRMNTLHHIRTEAENLEKKMKACLRNVESAQADITDSFDGRFELTASACQEGIQHLCEAMAYKLVFSDLSPVLWDSLYAGGAAASRIDPLLKQLDPCLESISSTVHEKLRNRAITSLMKASFDGFLLVVLAGGPSRSFSRQDAQVLEDDFKSLKDLYLADGDGLPAEVVEKAAAQAKSVLPLFRADAETLTERFKQLIAEMHGAVAKSKCPLPPTTGHWSPSEANTILRVLCHRNEEAASKFLKKMYNLPKKL